MGGGRSLFPFRHFHVHFSFFNLSFIRSICSRKTSLNISQLIGRRRIMMAWTSSLFHCCQSAPACYVSLQRSELCMFSFFVFLPSHALLNAVGLISLESQSITVLSISLKNMSNQVFCLLRHLFSFLLYLCCPYRCVFKASTLFWILKNLLNR